MNDRILRATGVVFLAAIVLHGVDHVRRGVDVVTTVVLTAGTVQFVVAVVVVGLVFRRRPAAARVAVVAGLASAVGFAAAHLLPHWSAFSDAFVGSHKGSGVTAFSWLTALFEIGADLAFAAAGFVVLRREASSPREPSGTGIAARPV